MPVDSLPKRSRDLILRRRGELEKRVEALKREAEWLQALIDEVEVELRQSSSALQQADEILGIAPEIPIEFLDREVRGRRLQEVAIRVLRSARREDEPIHYKEWFKLVSDRGVRISGKDPAANFLTQIAASPDIESVKPRSGLFRLRQDSSAI